MTDVKDIPKIYKNGPAPQQQNVPQPASGHATAGIIAGIIGFLILLAIIVTVVVMLRRRQRRRSDGPPTHKPPPPGRPYSDTERPPVSGPVPDSDRMYDEPMADPSGYDEKDQLELSRNPAPSSWVSYHDDKEEEVPYFTSSVTRESSFVSPAITV